MSEVGRDIVNRQRCYYDVSFGADLNHPSLLLANSKESPGIPPTHPSEHVDVSHRATDPCRPTPTEVDPTDPTGDVPETRTSSDWTGPEYCLRLQILSFVFMCSRDP